MRCPGRIPSVISAMNSQQDRRIRWISLADQLDKQSAEKDRKHREGFKKKIHDIAPAMKKALKEGNL